LGKSATVRLALKTAIYFKSILVSGCYSLPGVLQQCFKSVKETGEQSAENAASSKKISRHAAGAALSQAIVFVQVALATHIRRVQ